MTQEEKDLLLKDIFGRIPYGVKCSYLDIEFNKTTHGYLESFEYDDDKDIIFVIDGIGIYSEHVKPYLFPLSSMNEEQMEELEELCNMYTPDDDYHPYAYMGIEVLYKHVLDDGYKFSSAFNTDVIDWFNKNHFDYRGLIEKELAIDATNKNIY